MSFDVSGMASVGSYEAPGNPTFTLAAPAGYRFVAIGREVSITAFAPSWLSEASLNFRNSTESLFERGEFDLNPGFAFNEPGSGSFTSNGLIDLVPLALDFSINPDGALILQFYEDFDDPEVDVDAVWNSGSITMVFVPVPEPAGWALMALGLVGVHTVAGRRRRHQNR